MKEALQATGFAFAEIISQCPTSFGRRVGLRDGVAFMEHFQKSSINVAKAAALSEQELDGKIVVGTLARRDRTEFTESLRQINERVHKHG